MPSLKEVVKSISYDQEEIIENILNLYVKDKKIDCDPCYSKGNFYKSGRIQQPVYKLDISPQTDCCVKADVRNLPFDDSSFNCIIFDPPFLATKGPSLGKKGCNIINNRFGVYPTEYELHQFYVDSIKELYRVLDDNGILIFKCQDKRSSGTQYMSHVFIHNVAVEQGFYPIDLFILLAKNRIVANWQLENQQTARKFHSYFWVFKKCTKRVKYLEENIDGK